jgi:molybdenum cofactor cytidylyltransferase
MEFFMYFVSLFYFAGLTKEFRTPSVGAAPRPIPMMDGFIIDVYLAPGRLRQMMQQTASIAPIVLAAGDSTRMGYPKALLPFGSTIFLLHILDTIEKAGMGKPLVVLGKTASIVGPHIPSGRADVLVNPDPDRGQLSSIRLALFHLDPARIAGMIWPVDQPAISEEVVRDLVHLFLRTESQIAYPRCGNRRGHPAIFRRDLFQEFMDAPLEKGPREILLRHQKTTAELPTEELACIQDIDTPADYELLTGESLNVAMAKMHAGRNTA